MNVNEETQRPKVNRSREDTPYVPRQVTGPDKQATGLGRSHWLMLGLSIVIIGGFLLFPPMTVLGKTHLVGYGICHQIPARTFHLGGHPLPLCARCTGIYLGALLAVAGMSGWKRYRSVELPSTPLLLVLVSFIVIMGFDGINSYLTFFPNAPHLYEPQNWLRLTTGTLHGLAMGVIVFPVINGSLWHMSLARDEPVLKSFKELLLLVLGAGVIILVVLWQQPFLLYPLAVLSTLGVLMMLTFIMTAFVLVLTGREGKAHTWDQVIIPATMGLAASFLLIGGMDLLRAILTRQMGIPF